MDYNQLTNQSNSAHGSMQIYSIYRFFQVSAFILYFFVSPASSDINISNPLLFSIAAVVYLIFCFVTLLHSVFSKSSGLSGLSTLIILLSDVIAILAFIHFSGGIHGSLSILLIVTIAAASILLAGRFAFFIAASAVIGILSEQIFISFYTANPNSAGFVQTGILGFAFFGSALITQQLAKRLRESEQLATEQALQVQELEKLNEQIIERLPSGVIVVNDALLVKFMNSTAWRMLSMPSLPNMASLDTVSSELFKQLSAWLIDPNIKLQPFRPLKKGPSLSSNFIPLGNTREAGILIYLDDSSVMSEQAQKLKLASLGTLTAGIAHEIRNPLGAISHAAQLLGESNELAKADSRLATIIQEHSLRINRIIENVLQISRQKASNAKTIDLNQWLEGFFDEFRSTNNEEITAIVNPSKLKMSVNVDTSQLFQVLTNLCENGLRYSYEYSQQYYISLNTGLDPESNFPFLDVVDKGPGISPEDAEHIFEPFFTTITSGSGLGLYIARELCEANRARLEYIPIPTGGSCFRITFTSIN